MVSPEYSRRLDDPVAIAYRASHATGNAGLNPAICLPEDEGLEVVFDIPTFFSPVALDNALITTRRNREGEGIVENTTSIGHYDPAYQQWKFYSEMVDFEAWEPLGQRFDELYLEKLDRVQTEVKGYRALYRTPLTVLARLETSNLLNETGVAERIVSHHDDIYIDEATTCYLTITPVRANNVGTECITQYGPHTALTVVYNGLCKQQGVTYQRISHQQIIARFFSRKSEWQRNLDLVTSSEWRHLSQVPELFKSFRRSNEQFSTELNSVVS